MAWSDNFFQGHHLIGYSFGAWVAMAALTSEALSFTAIAPPLVEEDFSALPLLSLPVCLITAEQEALLALAHHPAHPQITYTTIRGADHFFLRQETEVGRQVVLFVKSHTEASVF